MKKGVIVTIFAVLVMAVVAQPPKKPIQTPLQASMARGAKVYLSTCGTCHQKDGGGVPHLNPPLQKTPWVSGDPNRLINIVLKGMNQPIEIDEEEYVNPMPAMAHLTDQQIADVLTYVRNSFGNKATAIVPARVKALRAKK